MDQKGFSIRGFLLGGIALVMLSFSMWGLYRNLAVMMFVEGECLITKAEIGSYESRNARGGSSRTVYLPKITYTYEVEGMQYEGAMFDDYLRMEGSAKIEDVQEILKNHVPGTRVKFWYDSNRPYDALLKNDREFTRDVFFLVFGLGFLGLSQWCRIQDSCSDDEVETEA